MYTIIALSLALLLNFALSVGANHVNCSWTGPGVKPEDHGWNQVCLASKYDDVSAGYRKAQYFCDTAKTVKVADWGYLDEAVLELATPCNGGGWAGPRDCNKGLFGFCATLYPTTNATYVCRYFDKNDDCSWPVKLYYDQLPDSIAIYNF